MANYTYYKTVLCENKDVPEMECNGKCQLMKEMALSQEEEEEETEPLVPRLDLSELPIASLLNQFCFETNLFKTYVSHNFTEDQQNIRLISKDVLCPPPDSVM